MNVLAPVNSIESALKMINSGANEIYLGADECIFETYSFTGRGKISYGNTRILPSYDSLKEIVDFAHQNNVKVNFIANIPYLHNGAISTSNVEAAFLKYVETGLKANVDSVVVGDIGLLHSVNQQNYKVELHASIYFKTLNSQQLLLLAQLGVTRTCLSYHVTLEEIEKLIQADIMDIEVVGYLGCSFYNGTCGFLHELGEGVVDDFDPGIACKNIFSIRTKNEIQRVSFDVERGCSICSLGSLDKIGVKALKIVGRDKSSDQMAEIVKLYLDMIQLHKNGGFGAEYVNLLPQWWRKIWCSKKRCKYRQNPMSKYIIG